MQGLRQCAAARNFPVEVRGEFCGLPAAPLSVQGLERIQDRNAAFQERGEIGNEISVPHSHDLPPSEPVELGLRLDLDIPTNAALASQANLFLMTDMKEAERRAELLEERPRRDVLHAALDVDSTLAALAEAPAIEVLLHARVELDAVLERHLTKIGALFAFDFLLFVQKRDLRHGSSWLRQQFFDGDLDGLPEEAESARGR